jgi:hypothetical protein
MAEHAKRVEAQSKFLIGAVEKHLMDGPEDVKTLAALSDHWWVQRQDGAQWIDMDPLLANLHQTDFQPPAEQTFAFDRPSGEIPLPAGYVHDLTIRVIVEQWNAVGVTERTALTHTFRPAEKFGEPIRLQNVPLAWPKNPVSVEDRDPRGTLRTTAAKQTEWLPLLRIGDKAIYQASFTEAGELNQKPGVAGRSSQDLKGPLGGFDALGGGEPEPSPGTSHLTAQWIEYETRVPGEVPTVIRRDVFDLFRQEPRSRPSLPDPNPNGETRANRALSLLSSVQILPMVCRLSADYVTFEILSGLIANRQTLAAIRAKHETGDLQAGADEAHRLKPVDEPLLNLAFARFEWNAVSQDVYLDAPNILSSRSILTPSGDVFASLAGFDIVTNNVAVRSGALASPKAIRLTQGIADTNAESLLLNQPAVSNAGEALGLVESSKSPWVLIRREVVPAGIGDAWPSDVRFRIHQALDAGYLVVAPRSLPNQKITNWVWWRIEPKSGETLGMGHLGWGQSMTDRVLMGLAGGLVIGVAAWQICLALRNRTPLSPAAYAKADQECACDAATGGFGILAAALSKNGTVGLAVGLAVKGAICTGTKQP